MSLFLIFLYGPASLCSWYCCFLHPSLFKVSYTLIMLSKLRKPVFIKYRPVLQAYICNKKSKGTLNMLYRNLVLSKRISSLEISSLPRSVSQWSITIPSKHLKTTFRVNNNVIIMIAIYCLSFSRLITMCFIWFHIIIIKTL